MFTFSKIIYIYLRAYELLYLHHLYSLKHHFDFSYLNCNFLYYHDYDHDCFYLFCHDYDNGYDHCYVHDYDHSYFHDYDHGYVHYYDHGYY